MLSMGKRCRGVAKLVRRRPLKSVMRRFEPFLPCHKSRVKNVLERSCPEVQFSRRKEFSQKMSFKFHNFRGPLALVSI